MANGPGGTGGRGTYIQGGTFDAPISYSSSYSAGNEGGGGTGGPPEFVSSSESDYDSTPSDGGGDTNPTPPTPGPGGDPTTDPSLGKAVVGNNKKGWTANIPSNSLTVHLRIVIHLELTQWPGALVRPSRYNVRETVENVKIHHK